MEWEKVFAKQTSDKRLIFKIYKKFISSIAKQTNKETPQNYPVKNR